MKNKHKLALFISHVYGDFQNSICREIINMANDYGYHLDIFVSNDESIIGTLGNGEIGLFNIPNLSSYHGIITTCGTYLVSSMKDSLLEFLKGATCPIIDINSPGTPLPSVLLDNNSTIKTLVKHLHSEHGIKDMFYLGCSSTKEISDSRMRAFVSGMDHHKLDTCNRILSCELEIPSVANAIDTIIQTMDTNAKQHAIVCYNDNLAFAAMEELTRRGYKIPQDFAVTGCDNLDYGSIINPGLTTLTFPAKELATKAFNSLLAMIDGVEEDLSTPVTSTPIYRGSCGCSHLHSSSSILDTGRLNHRVKDLEYQILKNIQMRGILHSFDNLDDFTGYIDETLKNMPGITSYYLFLHSNWNQMDSNLLALLHESHVHTGNNIDLQLGRKNGKLQPFCTYSNKEAVNRYLDNTGEEVHLFIPLYFEDKEYGFLCFTYEDNEIYYPFTFVNWIQNINMGLKKIADHTSMNSIKDYLNDLNLKDDLTGLYNRQGFHKFSLQLLKDHVLTGTKAGLISLEINDFQELSSRLGLEESNFSLQIFSKAIQNCCSEGCIVTRYRGAQFNILGQFENDTDVSILLGNIDKYLDNYERIYHKDYQLCFTYSHITLEGYTEDHLYESLFRCHQNKTQYDR